MSAYIVFLQPVKSTATTVSHTKPSAKSNQKFAMPKATSQELRSAIDDEDL